MIYNILDFGAVADGVTNNQPMIQRAIDACARTGGTVVVPAGRFLSGTLRLRSNMDFHLERGSTLIISRRPEDMISFTDYRDDGGTMDNITDGSFLYACHEKNLTISGEGCIDGRGREVFFDENADNGLHECPLSVNGFRPRTSYLEDVDGLTVRDVTFYDAAFWTLHMAGCSNVLVDGVRILNNDRGPNNDGIDPDACRNVIINNCFVESGDDAIVLKATKPMHEKYGDCENVVIRGCILHSRDSALKIGTETYGSIRNVIFADCIVRDCSRAVGIWVRDGGTIEDIQIHHLTGTTLRYGDCGTRRGTPRWWGVGEPVFLSAAYRSEERRFPGVIRGVTVQDCRLYCEGAVFLGGEKESRISDIRFENNRFDWRQTGRMTPALFDEQPSPRDVYEHPVPWLYARCVDGLALTGRYQPNGLVGAQAELEDCTAVRIACEPDTRRTI